MDQKAYTVSVRIEEQATSPEAAAEMARDDIMDIMNKPGLILVVRDETTGEHTLVTL